MAETQYTLGDPKAPPPKLYPGNTQYTLGDPNAPPPTLTNMAPAPAPAAAPAAPAAKKNYTQQEAAALGLGWVDPNNSHYGQAGFVGSENAAPTAAAAAPAAAAPAAPGAAPVTVNDAFKQAMLKGLTTGAPTMADPGIKAQKDAFDVQAQRAREQAQEAMAERRGGTEFGMASGGADQDLKDLFQKQGEATGSHDAQLLGDALTQQRDDLLKYVSLAGNQLSGEDSRALQEKLANLDAQIRREGIAQQGSLGEQDLALRTKANDQQGLLGLLNLLQGGSQFDTTAGLNTGFFNATRDDSNFWKSMGIF